MNPKWFFNFYEIYIYCSLGIYITWYMGTVVQNKIFMGLKVHFWYPKYPSIMFIPLEYIDNVYMGTTMVCGQSSLSFVGLEVLWHKGVSSWNHRFHLILSLSWLICDNTEETLGNVNEVPKIDLFSCKTGKPDANHGKHYAYQDTLTMSHHPYPPPKNAYPLTIQHFRLKIDIFPVKLVSTTLTKRLPW